MSAKKTKKRSLPKKAKKKPKITSNILIGDLVSKYPATSEVLLKYGLHCVGCHIAAYETIEEGARAHGLDERTINKMLDEMNNLAAGYKKQEQEEQSE